MGFMKPQFRVGDRVIITERVRKLGGSHSSLVGWFGRIIDRSKKFRTWGWVKDDVESSSFDYSYKLEIEGVSQELVKKHGEPPEKDFERIKKVLANRSFPGAVLAPTAGTMLVRKMKGEWRELKNLDELL